MVISQNLKIWLILLLTMFEQDAPTTAQIPDTLIFKGDTLSIFANPLEELYKDDSLRPNFFGDQRGCINTSCWRGYVAEWKIENDQLFLTGINTCCFPDDGVRASLKSLFGGKVINGVVKADWFSGSIIAPQGKLLHYVHLGYESIYEKELEFHFKDGRLVGIKKYDNSGTRESIYSKNSGKFQQFIYSNIRWDKLPDPAQSEIRVSVWFSANESGRVDSVKISKGYNPDFDLEAIRVIKMIPEWDVFYRHGKHQRVGWAVSIVFSNSNRRKYSQ